MYIYRKIIFLFFLFFLFGFSEQQQKVTNVADQVAKIEKELEKYKSGEAAEILKLRNFKIELDNAEACQFVHELPFFCPEHSREIRAATLANARQKGVALTNGLQYWTVITLTSISCIIIIFCVTFFLIYLVTLFLKRKSVTKSAKEQEQQLFENRAYLQEQRGLLVQLKSEIKQEQLNLDNQVKNGTAILKEKIGQKNEILMQEFLKMEEELSTKVRQREDELNIQKNKLAIVVKGLESQIAHQERKLQQKKSEFDNTEVRLQQSKADLEDISARATAAQQKLDLIDAFKK